MYILYIYVCTYTCILYIRVSYVCVCLCVHVCASVVCKYISFGRYERSLHGTVIKHKRRKNGEEQGDRCVTIIGRLKATEAATGAERPRRNSISHSGLFSVRVVTCLAPGSGRLFLKPGRSA